MDLYKLAACTTLYSLVEGLVTYPYDLVKTQQQRVLELVGRLEEDMVKGFPFAVPAPYDTAPLLKGRATVEMEVKIKDNPNVDVGLMTIVVDGFNAPVTGGNFVDLVDRGFYDGMDIQRSDGFVVQTGKPSAKGQDGFIDPVTRAKIQMCASTEALFELIPKQALPPCLGGTCADDHALGPS